MNFENNTAVNGGAIYITDSYGAKISASNFNNNTAVNGGGVYWDSTTHPSSNDLGTISDSTFKNNTGEDGAAIYWNDSKDGAVSNSEFTGNIASDGAVLTINQIANIFKIETSRFNNDETKTAIKTNSKLSLNKNELNDDEYIYLTSGSITTETHIIVLENDTIKYDDILFAKITDDNNNTVKLADSYGNLKFTLPDDSETEATQDENGIWSADYSFEELGLYEISAKHESLPDAVIYNGTANVLSVKQHSNLTVSAENIIFGENATAIIKLNSTARGNLTLTVNNEKYEFELNDTVNAIIEKNLTGLNAGNYTVSVSYTGDAAFLRDSNSTNLTVYKAEPVIIINADKIILGQNAVISAVLPEDATGGLTLTVNNETYNVLSGEEIIIPNLGVGNYEVIVNYIGDENYNETTNTTVLTVNRKDSQLTANVDGNQITANVVTQATGYILFKINGDDYYAEIDKGNANINVPSNLNPGQYTITVKYSGDDSYINNETETILNIAKIDSRVIVVSYDITAGEDAIITIILPEDAEGSVDIYVDNVKNNTIDAKGFTTYTLTGLNISENHEVKINYTGDEKYTANENTTTIKVNPITSFTFTVSVNDTKLNEKTNATIILPNDATGKIKIGDVEYDISNIIELPVQKITGKNNITVYYIPDETAKYAKTNITVHYNVVKLNQKIELNNVNAIIGDEIKIPVTSTGNSELTVIVDATEYNVIDGVAKIPANTLKAGKYTIIVKATENNNYTANSTQATLTITKKESKIISININPKSPVENEETTLTVTFADNETGIILVNINDNNYYAEINDGKAILKINNLSEGNNPLTIIYSGDENYNSSTNRSEINVTAKTPEIELETPTIEVSIPNTVNTTTIPIVEITLPNDVNGTIKILVDNELVNLTDANETLKILLENLNTGAHLIKIIYSGDNKYTPISTETAIAVIEQKEETSEEPIILKETEINLTVPGEVSVNESVNVKFTLPDGVGGNVSVFVDGVKVSEVPVNVVSVDLGILSVGAHAVEVKYSGDDKYAPASNVKAVLVKENQTPITPVLEDVIIDLTVPSEVGVNESVIVKFTLPDGVGGNVSVFVDGVKVSEVPVNVVSVDLGILSVGAHAVEVKYSGDDKYAPASNVKAVLVTKEEVPEEPIILKETEINLTVPGEVSVNESVIVKFTLPDGVGGNVSVFVDGVKVSEVSVNVVSVDLGILSVGAHAVEVKYSGDDKYAPASNVKAVLVKEETSDEPVIPQKADVNATVNVPDSVKTGETVNVTVELSKDATGNVSVIVDGKEVSNIPVENGTVSVPLTNLTSGAHIVEVKYSGDDKYESANAVNAIAVTDDIVLPTKKDTIITANQTLERVANDNTKAGEQGGDYYVTLKDTDGNALVNKTVEIAINGAYYYVQTDEQGRAHQQVNMESANVYTYAFAFQGDDEYNAAPLTSTRLTVTKKTTSIAAVAKSYKKSATKKYTVTLKTSKNPFDGKTYLASGKKITLKVNGKTYNGKTNSKNQVTFTIKLTKKGTFTAKIKFAGSKIYAASSKTVKITIV